jgi:hypothetical protein
MDAERQLAAAALAVAVVTLSFFCAALVLQPMDRAARAKVALIQFTVLDFLSLTAYLAVPLAAVAQLTKNQPGSRDGNTTWMVIGCAVAGLIWWGSVRTAAKAGIRHPWKRLLMIAVIVPLTYAVALVGGLYVGFQIGHYVGNRQPAPPLFYFATLSWLAYFLIARRLVVWILSADAAKAQANGPWSDQVTD